MADLHEERRELLAAQTALAAERSETLDERIAWYSRAAALWARSVELTGEGEGSRAACAGVADRLRDERDAVRLRGRVDRVAGGS